MKIFLGAFVLVGLALAQDKAAEMKHIVVPIPHGNRNVSLAALSIERGTGYPTVIKLNGSVEIKSPVCVPTGQKGAVVCDGYTLIHADEAAFHEDTGQIEAHGSVTVTPVRRAAP